MTYEEALLWFKKRIHQMQKDYEDAVSINRSGFYIKQIEQSIQIAECSIEALEKQIPKKPIYNGIYYQCPECLDAVGRITSLGRLITNHHCWCGQRIDWTEVKK